VPRRPASPVDIMSNYQYNEHYDKRGMWMDGKSPGEADRLACGDRLFVGIK